METVLGIILLGSSMFGLGVLITLTVIFGSTVWYRSDDTVVSSVWSDSDTWTEGE